MEETHRIMTSMERWWNKVAVVTGASSGIGAACAIDLVKGGMIVAGIARRKDRLEVLREKLPDELKSRIHSYKCDVSKEADVIQTFQLIKENLGTVHVLVNSAGMASSIELTGMYCTDEIRENINLGIMGAAFCIREAFNQMKEANVKGHIVLMNSTFGRRNSPFPLGSLNIYPAVKSALIAMSETYIKEFSSAGTDIKMTVSLTNMVKFSKALFKYYFRQ